MKRTPKTMKTLSTRIFLITVVVSQVSFCAAQSNEASNLEVIRLMVKDFRDSEAVFKALEKGNIYLGDVYWQKITWDDVKKRLEMPDFVKDDPNYYFRYAEINLIEFTKEYDGKRRVGFYVPGRMFETGLPKFILSIKYEDFKKIVNKKYSFEIDF